ncbi:hypothetical protein GCM10009710_04520 [Aeromicrobium alkaliterrae]|uniref:Uncharacterized protein n=1 Tax=Aeromicrobium alkaliterrae TaxID=302168 RepID=A0ABP4VLT1_9ACTN
MSHTQWASQSGTTSPQANDFMMSLSLDGSPVPFPHSGPDDRPLQARAAVPALPWPMGIKKPMTLVPPGGLPCRAGPSPLGWSA